MAKKHKKKSKKKRYTGISDHKRKGKLLQPPLATLDRMVTKSWLNEQIPEMLWATLVVDIFDRKDILNAFRAIAALGRKFHDQKDLDVGITHSDLSRLDESLIKDIINIIISHPLGYAALRPLLFFQSLPGYERWAKLLDVKPYDSDWDTIRSAVVQTLDHQSQESTDVRWLTILFKIAAGKVVFPNEMEERAIEIIEYPNRGNMRSVRPIIRAMEMAFRDKDGNQSDWSQNFWDTCYKETPCIRSITDSVPLQFHLYDLFERVLEIKDSLENHWKSTAVTTAVDAMHDSSFGFCFFALSVLEEICKPGNNYTIIARFSLRSLVECLVTFNYLVYKNTDLLWKSYRVYGSGQAKLAFLKLEENSNDIPTFVDKNVLENLANEDIFQEYLSIDIGHWDKTNLRKMAEESGIKEEYDKYYSWTSSYLHGQWASVRDSVFITCLNPLHRLHRIPRLYPRILEDVIPDALDLANKILELLDKIYPGFSERLKISDLQSS